MSRETEISLIICAQNHQRRGSVPTVPGYPTGLQYNRCYRQRVAQFLAVNWTVMMMMITLFHIPAHPMSDHVFRVLNNYHHAQQRSSSRKRKVLCAKPGWDTPPHCPASTMSSMIWLIRASAIPMVVMVMKASCSFHKHCINLTVLKAHWIVVTVLCNLWTHHHHSLKTNWEAASLLHLSCPFPLPLIRVWVVHAVCLDFLVLTTPSLHPSQRNILQWTGLTCQERTVMRRMMRLVI